MTIEIGISHLKIFGDSKLIINQTLEQYDVKKEDLVPYCKYAKKLLTNFEAITLEHILRKENRQADALANLATTLALSQEEIAKVAVSQRWVVPSVIEEEKEEKQANVISVCLVEKEDWRQKIIEYLQHGRLPDDGSHDAKILSLSFSLSSKKEANFEEAADIQSFLTLGSRD
ncbi:uncharacterized protein LOC142644340 [Castanea sativa]|uniref:uncharacterized protein LOC142644340 n=1 Tax=Castanea sativa TaxID=21020 RepID=UPI003F64FC58